MPDKLNLLERCCGGTRRGSMCREFRGLRRGPGIYHIWTYCWRHMPASGRAVRRKY